MSDRQHDQHEQNDEHDDKPEGEGSDDREIVDDAPGGPIREGIPSDNTTLTAVLAEVEADGYTSSFVVQPGGELMCTTCRETTTAEQVEPRLTRRLEGASDPSDELWVVAAACPNCEALGSVVLGFGPEASEDDAVVVARLDVEPD